jgi:hypothetical protein
MPDVAPTTFRPDPIEVLGVVVVALSLGALVMLLFLSVGPP